MSISYSFIGAYRFDSPAAIESALDELREVLDSEHEIPSPFTTGEIMIDGSEVRFAIEASTPSHWFEHYDTIVETFADHARSGEVTVRCEDETDIYKAGPVRAE